MLEAEVGAPAHPEFARVRFWVYGPAGIAHYVEPLKGCASWSHPMPRLDDIARSGDATPIPLVAFPR